MKKKIYVCEMCSMRDNIVSQGESVHVCYSSASFLYSRTDKKLDMTTNGH